MFKDDLNSGRGRVGCKGVQTSCIPTKPIKKVNGVSVPHKTVRGVRGLDTQINLFARGNPVIGNLLNLLNLEIPTREFCQ